MKLEIKEKKFKKEEKNGSQRSCRTFVWKAKNISGQVIPSFVVWGEDLGGRGQTRTEEWEKKKEMGCNTNRQYPNKPTGGAAKRQEQAQHTDCILFSPWMREQDLLIIIIIMCFPFLTKQKVRVKRI